MNDSKVSFSLSGLFFCHLYRGLHGNHQTQEPALSAQSHPYRPLIISFPFGKNRLGIGFGGYWGYHCSAYDSYSNMPSGADCGTAGRRIGQDFQCNHIVLSRHLEIARVGFNLFLFSGPIFASTFSQAANLHIVNTYTQKNLLTYKQIASTRRNPPSCNDQSERFNFFLQ